MPPPGSHPLLYPVGCPGEERRPEPVGLEGMLDPGW